MNQFTRVNCSWITDHAVCFFLYARCVIYLFSYSRVRVSGPAGIVGGGVNVQRSLHLQYHDWGETLEQGTEPPTAPRALQHWLPTAPGCVHGVCVCVCVCMCLFTTHCCVCALGWVKCRAQIPSMGHHTWPHITYFPFSFSLIFSWIFLYYHIWFWMQTRSLEEKTLWCYRCSVWSTGSCSPRSGSWLQTGVRPRSI